jgi:hypothetical protein
MLFPHRKARALVVLDAHTGQEVTQVRLPGRPASRLHVWEDQVYLWVQQEEGVRPWRLESVKRAEDLPQAPPAWKQAAQGNLDSAALTWYLQGCPLAAALALADAGLEQDAQALWEQAAPQQAALVSALQEQQWPQAWQEALLDPAPQGELLAEILRRWASQAPGAALEALERSLERLPQGLAWRRRVDGLLQQALRRPPWDARWQALRPRFWRAPHLVVTLTPEPAGASLRAKRPYGS